MTILLFTLLLVTFAVWEVLRRRADMSPLLSLALLVYLLMWNVVPSVYGTFLMDWSDAMTTPPAFQRVAVIHVATLLATLTLLVMLPARVHAGLRDAFGTTPTPPAVAFNALLVGTVVFAVGAHYALQLRGGSFAEAVAFVMTASAEQAGRVAIIDAVLTVVLGLGLAAVLVSWPAGGRRIAIAGAAIVAMHVAASLMQGMRAVILLPVQLVIARNWQASRDGQPTHWKAAVLLLASTVVLAPLVAAVIGVVRLAGTTNLDVAAVREGYETAAEVLSPVERAQVAALELNRKFDGITTGASLLDREGVGTGGWRPYSSSLLSPIPRVLLPGKPVPTSSTGDNAGVPYRVAAEPYGMVELGMVVPVSPVAITIWEVGYLGIVLVIVGNLVAFVIMNTLLAAGSIFARALGVGLLSLPTTEFLFAPPSGLLRDHLRMAMYLVLLWAVIQGIMAVRRASLQPAFSGGDPSPQPVSPT